jgi:chromosome segregation ATPase
MGSDRDLREALEQAQAELRGARKRISALEAERKQELRERERLHEELLQAREEIAAAIADGQRLASVLATLRSKHPGIVRDDAETFVESPQLNSAARDLGRAVGKLLGGKRKRTTSDAP